MSFVSELKRRNVVKAAIAYAALSWLLIQLVTTVEDPLGLPSWFDTFIIVCLALGFPIVLVFAWAYELTPDGIKLTESVERAASITPRTGRRLTQVTIGVLAAAVALLLVDRFVLDQRNYTLPNSIAVLPFENLSPDRGDAYFAPGLHEEILNRLEKIQNLIVIARTTMSQYEGTDKTIAEIAAELNVEAVMEGSVRFNDGRVAITAQLIDPVTGGHLWSETYLRSFEDVFAIEADVAMNVANAMAVEFSLDEQRLIEKNPTESIAAYELYLAARVAGRNARFDEALDFIDSALAIDPKFALALALKAYTIDLLVGLAPADQREQLASAQRDAALAAAAIDPDAREVRAQLAVVRATQGEWIEAEEAYRAVFGPEFLGAEWGAALFSLAAGNFERVQRMAAYSEERDPFNQDGGTYSILGFGLTGNIERANEDYARKNVGSLPAGPYWISLLRLRADATTTIDEIPLGGFHKDELRQYLGAPDEGRARVHAIVDALDNPSVVELVELAVWAAYFGDPDFSFDLGESAVEAGARNMITFWFPAMREVRRMPRFRRLLREIGLVDYWDEFGWPPLCQRIDDTTFECD